MRYSISNFVPVIILYFFIAPLHAENSITKLQTAAKNTSFMLPSGVKVKITEAPFNASKFNIQGCSGLGKGCLIDGSIPFGNDGQLPKTYLKSITIAYKNTSYSLDVSNMYDAWNSRPLEYKGVVRYFGGNCFDDLNCQFRGLFSDAAGSFVAEWIIVNGIQMRTDLAPPSRTPG